MPHDRPPAARARFDADGNLLVSIPWQTARRALAALRAACPSVEVSAEGNPLYGMAPDAVVAVVAAERHLRRTVEVRR